MKRRQVLKLLGMVAVAAVAGVTCGIATAEASGGGLDSSRELAFRDSRGAAADHGVFHVHGFRHGRRRRRFKHRRRRHGFRFHDRRHYYHY